jgi:general stress protein YciG
MQHPETNPTQIASNPSNESLAPEPKPEAIETQPAAERPRKPRGFATMDRSRVIEIARKGGQAAHTAGTAHEFTTEEAREAGRKGGKAMHENRKRRQSAAQQ